MRLIEDGQTQSEIAREFGVTRQYVSRLAVQGGYVNKSRVVSDNLPWEVHRDFAENTIYKNVRRHGIAMAHGVNAVGRADQAHLRSFHRKLVAFNVVVDYDPSYPAVPGFSNTPGFAFVPRSTRDRDFVIKIRPDLNLTQEGLRLWRMPAENP